MLLVILLAVLLVLSLLANGYQWHRWHSYRSKPAGQHSHTGMIPLADIRKELNARPPRR
jgi:hypothetical protein